ncbi:DUF5320 domain-containing protein [Candidatus Micrarchaeota archaeon]|nr:DUF5320 domain-containing protein [Candidatus Micrarchaeota archaeon]
MPYGDGTGPRWAQGNWNCRRGFGRMGFGPGFGRRYVQQPINQAAPNQNEVSDLESYEKELRSELAEIQTRLTELRRKSK